MRRLLLRHSPGNCTEPCRKVDLPRIDYIQELTNLIRALNDVSLAKSSLDDLVFVNQRKDTLKAFKQSVASMIECGELAAWIGTVDKEELVNHGAEANRLFQLLIEGKKANSLLVDSTALTSAAARADLFSEAEMLKETERLVEEEKKRNDEEKVRMIMEERARQIGMKRGACVRLFGLKKHEHLNGQLGRYMGVAPGSSEARYIIKVVTVFPSKEVALKTENFQLLDGNLNDEAPATSVDVKVDEIHENKSPAIVNHIQELAPSPSAALSSRKPARAKVPLVAQPDTSSPHTKDSCRPARTKNTAWIDRKFVSAFIGHGGMNVKKFQVDAGTKVYVNEKQTRRTPSNEWVAVQVRGDPQKVKKALNLIEGYGSPFAAEQQSSVSNCTVAKQPLVANGKQNSSSAQFASSGHIAPPMVIKSPPTSETKPPSTEVGILEFLSSNKACLKTPPETFFQWLQSQDIASLSDLAEGVNDAEFLAEMISNGLKGFKKGVFRKALQNASQSSSYGSSDFIPVSDNGLGGELDKGPPDLYCPISFVLMKDPVVAADGFTYDRSAISSWFARNASQKAVLSPMTQEPLPSLGLTPNVAIRNLALEYV